MKNMKKWLFSHHTEFIFQNQGEGCFSYFWIFFNESTKKAIYGYNFNDTLFWELRIWDQIYSMLYVKMIKNKENEY